MTKRLETAIHVLAEAAKEVEEALNESYFIKRRNLHGFTHSPSIQAHRFTKDDVDHIIRLNRFEESSINAIRAVAHKWEIPIEKTRLPRF